MTEENKEVYTIPEKNFIKASNKVREFELLTFRKKKDKDGKTYIQYFCHAFHQFFCKDCKAVLATSKAAATHNCLKNPEIKTKLI